MLNDTDFDDFLEAGKIASKAREFGVKLIKIDANIAETCDKIEEFIFSKGAKLAFPAQISLNHIAAHYCSPKDSPLVFKKGDLAKLDVGVHINGLIGDTAKSVNLGNHENLIEASQKALDNALDIVKPGILNSDVGKVIENTIKSYGYTPINNLSGHGLGKFLLHGKPSMPNFDTKEGLILKSGMTFAIEPFATNGAGFVIDSHDAEIFSLSKIKPVRSPITRSILTEIKSFDNLPFCSRWLANKFGSAKVNFALRELLNKDCLRMFPPLSDRGNGLVSQTEHSVVLEEDKAIISTK
jgi:methionyl aminopeptidase